MDTKGFGRHVMGMFYVMQAAEGGYEGVTHAGIALVAADTGRVFLAQRSMDTTDDPAVQETWEFPGGGVNDGENPVQGMLREWSEEIGAPLPEDAEIVDGWRAGPESDTGNYQGFVGLVPTEFPLDGWEPTSEVQAVAWFAPEDVTDNGDAIRPEVREHTPWDKVWGAVSEKEVPAMTASAPEAIDGEVIEEYEPEFTGTDFDLDGPIPVHGVIAPEEMPSGDRRAFSKGAMTRRPLAIPLRDTPADIGGHDGAVPVGRVDRMMRSGGLIHWEGSLMPGRADDLAEKIEFFGGKYGVSVDGDQGNMDEERTAESGTVWFDSIRAAGLTAVDIPAFHEAYVAFGLHPSMPSDEVTTASAFAAGDLIGARSYTGAEKFDRGAGWVTNPKETKTIHDYWTKKGEPGYAKIGWGTRGDFTRAKKLIGAKIAEHSPEKMKYLNQIIAQWHHDALGYWPGDLDMPGNKTSAEAKAERKVKAAADTGEPSGMEVVDKNALADLLDESENQGIEVTLDPDSADEVAVWETVLVSSAGVTVKPPLNYFHKWDGDDKALTIEEPDAFGIRRVHGWAAQWGVCHVGMQGRCVEPPRTYSDDYPAFHLGVTHTTEGKVYTGVLTYGVGHRDADTILNESPEQAYFDNVDNAWAAVRIGEDEEGIWFSGYALPGVPEDHLTKIQASGQVSGEWLGKDLRACLTVNVPGFAVERPSVAYDSNGNVMALAASAFGQGEVECKESDLGSEQDQELVASLADEVMSRIQARQTMDALRSAEVKQRMARVRMSLVMGEF